MELLLTHEDLEKLWHKDQVTISDDIRLYLYWDQLLQHLSHISMVQLAEKKVIPSAIKYIQKMPPYTACLFVKAQRRAWKDQRKKLRFVRKKHHTTPGDGTSANHIVSHQPGLVPQVTGRLTHEKLWGKGVTMVDHATSFVYPHLIRGTTAEETLAAKEAYEQVLNEYEHRVKSYHGDNSRFDSSDFQESCKKAQ
eukprot:13335951-Ditylum_brightwellii.AAC.1